VIEQCWRAGQPGKRLRPFCQRAQIRPRRCSLGVQRALADFGVEHAFASAAARFREHYGWEVAPSVVRQWTLHHAGQCHTTPRTPLPSPHPGQKMVTGLDGSMAPVVKPAAEGDRRKKKTLLYREVRVAFARPEQSATARYGTSLDEAFGAGLMWRETAEWAGLTDRTDVHALGDGATWIIHQSDRQFGTHATYLVDLQHVTSYLAGASPRCAPDEPAAWVHRQKQRLCENRAEELLAELKAREESEPKDAEGKTPPVRQAWQYIEDRKNHLDYRGALAAGLPIGSGEVESAHRHIVQARIKKAGAWWRENNLAAVLQLRTLRANDHWIAYWNNVANKN
jgi:hypothetical protein